MEFKLVRDLEAKGHAEGIYLDSTALLAMIPNNAPRLAEPTTPGMLCDTNLGTIREKCR